MQGEAKSNKSGNTREAINFTEAAHIGGNIIEDKEEDENYIQKKEEETLDDIESDEEDDDDHGAEIHELASSSSSRAFIEVVLNVLVVVAFLVHFRNNQAYDIYNVMKSTIENKYVSQLPPRAFAEMQTFPEAANFMDELITWFYQTPTYSPKTYFNNNASNLTSLNFLQGYNQLKGMLIYVIYNPYIMRTETSGYDEQKIYLPGNIDYDSAMEKVSSLKNVMHNASEEIYMWSAQSIIYNVITEAALVVNYSCTFDDNGHFAVGNEVNPFYPSFFKDGQNKADLFPFIVFIIFTLYLILAIIKIIISDIYKMLNSFYQTHRLNIEGMLVFNVLYLTMLSVIMVNWFLLISTKSVDFTQFDTLNTMEDFQEWLDFISDTKKFIVLVVVGIVLITVKLLIVLNTQFPSFGILFYTIAAAQKELFIFAITIITLLVGFVTVMVNSFGIGDPDASTWAKACFESFQLLLGASNYSNMENADSTLAPIYFFMFYIVFNLVVLLVFVVIIMSTYVKLRKKIHTKTQALTKLTAARSSEKKDLIIDLLLCRNSEDYQGNDIENRRNVTTKTTWQKIKRNLEKLDYFGFTSRNRQTREAFEKELREKEESIKNEIKRIRQERLDYRKCDTIEAKERIKNNMKGSFFHILFIIIYVVTMGYEIPKGDSFLVNQAVQDYFTSDVNSKFTVSYQNETKTFSKISNIEDIYAYLNQTFFPKIFPSWSTINETSTEAGSVTKVYTQTYFIGDPVIRMTLRRHQLEQLPNTLYVKTSSDEFNWYNKEPPSENTTNYTYPQYNISVDYTPPGTIATPAKAGGYVFELPRNVSELYQTYSKLVNINFLDIELASLVVETLLYNPNVEMYCFNRLIFQMNAEGFIAASIEPMAFKMVFYSNGDGGRIFFEILYVIAIIFQIRNLVKNWIRSWKDKNIQSLTPVKPELQKPETSKLSRLLNFNLEDKDYKYFDLFIAIIKRTWQILNRLYETTKHFITSHYANLLLSVSIILTITALIELLLIVFDPFRLSFSLDDLVVSNYTGISLHGDFERVAELYDTYVTLQAFNAYFLVMRLLLVFGFSGELSIVLDLISDALLDFVFFILMFCLIMFGFATVAYLNFGAQDPNFCTISEALLSCIYVLVASLNVQQYNVTDTAMLVIWIVSYMILMALVLLNMFIAILEGYFRQIAPKGNEEQVGFLDLLKYLVISEFKNIEEKKKKKEAQQQREKLVQMRRNRISLHSNKSPKKSEKGEGQENNASEPDEIGTGAKLPLEKVGHSPVAQSPDNPEEDKSDLEEELALEEEAMKARKPQGKCKKITSKIESKLEDVWFWFITFIYNKIIKKFLFTDQPAEGEGQAEPPQITAKVEFEEKRDIIEEDVVLKDIEFYLGKKDHPSENQKISVELAATGPSAKADVDEQQRLKLLAEEEKELTNKWVSSLEETLLKLSGGKINITRMGTNTKDYLFDSGSYTNTEQFMYEEALKDKNDLPPEVIIEKLAKETTEDYKANSKLFKSADVRNKHYENFCFKLKLIFYVSDRANNKKGLEANNDLNTETNGENNNHVTVEDEEIEQSKSKAEDEEEEKKEDELDFDTYLHDRKEAKHRRTSKIQSQAFIEEKAREKVLEVWNLLTLSQKAKVWSGSQRSYLSMSHRLEIWRCMTYHLETFTKFSKNILPLLIEKKLRTDAISDREVEAIWKQLYKTPERFTDIKVENGLSEDKTRDKVQSPDAHINVTEARVDEFEDDGEDEQMKDMISKGLLKTNVAHIKLIDNILKFDGGKLLSQLSKKKSQREKIKHLKTIKFIKDDPKLMLWLLTPPHMRIELILGTPNNYVAVFQMYLLLEEIYNSPIIMMKMEKDLNSDFKNRLYMYFMMYASYEANQTLIANRREKQFKADDGEMLNYVKFLEKQLKNTNNLKARYKKEIQVHLDVLREIKNKAQEDDDDDELSPTKVNQLIQLRRRQSGLSSSQLIND